MEVASSAINNFLGKAGKKDTTVDQTVNPAVEHETIKKHHEQRDQTVIDRERIQDHYHTTIQPLVEKEKKQTTHSHEQAKTQHREFEHDDVDKTKAKVEQQRQQFKNTVDETATKKTQTQQETVEGEHVHHHLHETIQPIIEKETVVPTVTHKTIPIKERHHEKSQHHGLTRNTPMTVDEFRHKLQGEPTRAKDAYEGTPQIESVVDGKPYYRSVECCGGKTA